MESRVYVVRAYVVRAYVVRVYVVLMPSLLHSPVPVPSPKLVRYVDRLVVHAHDNE